jgi:hypothetical protein
MRPSPPSVLIRRSAAPSVGSLASSRLARTFLIPEESRYTWAQLTQRVNNCCDEAKGHAE